MELKEWGVDMKVCRYVPLSSRRWGERRGKERVRKELNERGVVMMRREVGK